MHASTLGAARAAALPHGENDNRSLLLPLAGMCDAGRVYHRLEQVTSDYSTHLQALHHQQVDTASFARHRSCKAQKHIE